MSFHAPITALSAYNRALDSITDTAAASLTLRIISDVEIAVDGIGNLVVFVRSSIKMNEMNNKSVGLGALYRWNI